MAGRERLSAVLRGVATYALLCLGSYFFGSSLVRAMTPAFKLEIETLAPEYKVTEFHVERAKLDLVVESAGRRQPKVQVTLGYSKGFTYPILVLSLLAGWRFPSRRRRFLALGVGALLALVVMMVDLPAEELLSLAEHTQKKPFFLSFFFANGGRQFVGLLVFLSSLAAGSACHQQPSCERGPSTHLRSQLRVRRLKPARCHGWRQSRGSAVSSGSTCLIPPALTVRGDRVQRDRNPALPQYRFQPLVLFVPAEPKRETKKRRGV